jgi:type IV pilus assembly protein PilZ
MDYRKKDGRSDEGDAVEEDRRSGPERRQYQRILVDLEVDYKCEDTFLFAYITDLSALGIFIRTNNPEPAGTHLNLRFTLPGDEKPLALEGEVIWINPFRPGNFDNINPGMGVRFCDMTPELKQHLVRLVRKIAYLEDDSNPDAGRIAEGEQAEAKDAKSDEPESEDFAVTVDASNLKS